MRPLTPDAPLHTLVGHPVGAERPPNRPTTAEVLIAEVARLRRALRACEASTSLAEAKAAARAALTE